MLTAQSHYVHPWLKNLCVCSPWAWILDMSFSICVGFLVTLHQNFSFAQTTLFFGFVLLFGLDRLLERDNISVLNVSAFLKCFSFMAHCWRQCVMHWSGIVMAMHCTSLQMFYPSTRNQTNSSIIIQWPLKTSRSISVRYTHACHPLHGTWP